MCRRFKTCSSRKALDFSRAFFILKEIDFGKLTGFEVKYAVSWRKVQGGGIFISRLPIAGLTEDSLFFSLNSSAFTCGILSCLPSFDRFAYVSIRPS